MNIDWNVYTLKATNYLTLQTVNSKASIAYRENKQ